MESSTTHSAVRTLLQASSALLRNHELPDVLEAILNVAEGTLAADAYALWRKTRNSETWSIHGSHGLSREYIETSGAAYGALTNSHEPILLDDLHNDARLSARMDSLLREGVSAMGAFPVIVSGEPSATLVFYFRAAHRFTAEELDYASTVANLAGAAITNSELISSQSEAAKRADVLARITSIINSSLDFDRTAQSVADAAVPVLADWCSLAVFAEGKLTQIAVAHQDPGKLIVAREFNQKYPERLDPERGALKVMQTGVPELMSGVTDELLTAAAIDEEHLRLMRALEVHSFLTVPLQAAGQSIGILRLVSSSNRAELTWEDVAFAQEIAARAANALENARLHREQLVLAEQLRRLNDIGRTLTAQLDRPKLVQAVTDLGTEGTGAQFGAFFYNVEDGDGGSYMLYTVSGVDRSHFDRFPMPRNTQVFGPTFAGQGTVRSADITADPRYGKNEPYFGMPEGHLPVRSYLAVPVRRNDGSVLGGLFFGHQRVGVFTEETARFAEAIASQASIALINADLYMRAQRELEARWQTQVNLDRERNFLRLALRVAEAGTWELDFSSDPPMATWSSEIEEMYGLRAGSFHGSYLDWVACLHPEDRQESQRLLEEAIRTGSQWQHEFRVVRPDGQIRWVAGRGQCFYDASGKPVTMAGINMDVTERRGTEAALMRSEKLASAGRMAATIAHEINNPLEAVTNLIFLARCLPDGEKDALLDTADRELQRVAHITRQTLGFYKEPTAPREFDVRGTIEQVVSLLGMAFQRKHSSARLDMESIRVMGVEGEIRQALSNLISNALDASPLGKDILIRVRRTYMGGTDPRDAVRISVADAGEGIDPESRAKIFEPFFTTKKEVGTGLGLWVVREIVSKHGGRVQVRSRSGRGTTMSLLLPVNGKG